MSLVSCSTCCNAIVKQPFLECACCSRQFHKKCTVFSSSISDWYCTVCIEEIFPFNHISNDFDFHSSLGIDPTFHEKTNSLRFDPFSMHNAKDVKPLLNDGELDPEQNYYNDFQLKDSKYTTAFELNTLYSGETNLNVLHINCRSIKKL